MSCVLKEYSSSPALEFVFSHAHFFFLLCLAHGESRAVFRAQPLLFFLALCVLSRPSGRSSLARCLQCLVSLSPSCGKKSVHRNKVECTQAACQALPLHACRALPVLREAGCEQAFDTDCSLSPRGVGQPCPLCRDFFSEMTGRKGSGRNLSLSG